MGIAPSCNVSGSSFRSSLVSMANLARLSGSPLMNLLGFNCMQPAGKHVRSLRTCCNTAASYIQERTGLPSPPHVSPTSAPSSHPSPDISPAFTPFPSHTRLLHTVVTSWSPSPTQCISPLQASLCWACVLMAFQAAFERRRAGGGPHAVTELLPPGSPAQQGGVFCISRSKPASCMCQHLEHVVIATQCMYRASRTLLTSTT
jgi:hypothetical protein